MVFLSENLPSLTFSLTSFLLLESNRSGQTVLPVFIQKYRNVNLLYSGHALSYTSTKLSQVTRMSQKQRKRNIYADIWILRKMNAKKKNLLPVYASDLFTSTIFFTCIYNFYIYQINRPDNNLVKQPLGQLTKWQLHGDALFWNGKSLFHFHSPKPIWNSGSTLDEST